MFQKISKNQLKQFASLKEKKTREKEGLFIAEGEKIIDELIHSDLEIISILAINEWLTENTQLLKKMNHHNIFEVTTNELQKISSLKTPNNVIAVARIPEVSFQIHNLENKLTLVLSNIQDPGNLGTIIRLADWFGIETIVCSKNTVELFNPKVIQSTMGAFLRVNVFYENLVSFFEELNPKIPVYGAFLDGKNIYNETLPGAGIIVMGNESKGISNEIEKYVTHKITIPTFTQKPEKTESLNVSVATAIICSEFRRRN